MTLDEYIKGSKEDSNFFWRLHPGDMQNLLDEAVEVIEELEKRLEESELDKHRNSRRFMVDKP